MLTVLFHSCNIELFRVSKILFTVRKAQRYGFLTLYEPDYFFRRFSGHNLRKVLFVYRLIGATLIEEIFFHVPS